MTLARSVRWSHLILILPLILVATALALADGAQPNRYSVSATAQAWISAVLSAPLLSAWAAWESGRLRAWVRGHAAGGERLRALVPTVLRPLGAAALITAAMIAVANPDLGSAGAVAWNVLGAMTLVTAVVAGAVAGIVLPRYAATPVALIGWYAWLAFPLVLIEPWWRASTITGGGAMCCLPQEQLATRTLVTTLLVAGILLVGSLVTLERHRHLAATALAVLVVAGSTAFVLGRGGSETATEPRQSELVCRSGEGVDVCVWPENEDDLSAIVSSTASVTTDLGALGSRLPTSWSENPDAAGVTFSWSPDTTPEEQRGALALSVVQHLGCDSAGGSDVRSFVLLQSGLSQQEIDERFGPVSEQAARASSLGAPAQRAWIQQAVAECDGSSA